MRGQTDQAVFFRHRAAQEKMTFSFLAAKASVESSFISLVSILGWKEKSNSSSVL
jgi:hypothetical protein